jgi:hypothetical protein
MIWNNTAIPFRLFDVSTFDVLPGEPNVNTKYRIGFGVPITAALLTLAGCGEFFLNLTASLGGGTAGGRGTVRVLFINNTPHRAVFTYGSYDQTDQFSQPDFAQFGLKNSARHLDGDAETSLDPFESGSYITCARVFGIGSPEMLRLIEENRSDAETDEDALVEGVEFFQIGGDDGQDPGAEPVSIGFAPPFEALLGVDFPCSALLIIYFEINDPGPDPFRIDFQLVPSESDR